MKINIGSCVEFDTDTFSIDTIDIDLHEKPISPWKAKAVSLLSAMSMVSDAELPSYISIDIIDLEVLEALAFEVNPETRELYDELQPLRSWLNNLASFSELKPSSKTHSERVNQLYRLTIDALADMVSVS